MSVFELIKEDLPAWYDLAAPEGRLEIRIHNAAFAFLRRKVTASRYANVDERLQLPPFIEPAEQWGFGEVLSITSQDKDWTTFQCQLPIVQESAKANLDWKSAYAVCATFNVLFSWLSTFEEDTGSDRKQLLGIKGMGIEVGREKAWGIYAVLSPTLCSWMTERVGKSEGVALEEVSTTMLAAYQYMCRQNEFTLDAEDDFGAFIKNPRMLHMECPSGCCCLETDELFDGDPNYGAGLVPHNMDNALQQLTLLTGIADLLVGARREGR